MTELSLPHYILFRKDRSRHGGGIAIYISASLNSSVPFSVPSHSLEFLSLSFTFLKRSFHIGCFYRPPTSSSDLLSLTNLLLSAGPSFTSRLILVGDFNVNLLGNPSHLSRQLTSLLSLLSLRQVVSLPTHFSHLGTPSIIDLVLIPSSFKDQISINPPIGTSDHNTILTSIPFPLAAPPPKPSPKMSWKYHLADFPSINESLRTIHWDTILPPNIDAAWSTFSNIFVSIIHNYTPCQVIPSSPFPPRFPHSLIRKIHKRRHLYRQAVISQNPFIW